MKKASRVSYVVLGMVLIAVACIGYLLVFGKEPDVSVKTINQKYELNFTAVEDATNFKVKINGEEVVPAERKLDITDYLIDDDTYVIEVMYYDINGEFMQSKTYSYEYSAKYESDFLRKGEFFMNGRWYDYVIDSQSEFYTLVWHTILYRQNDVSFYVEDSSQVNALNINNLATYAIDNYPEYDAVNQIYGKYATLNFNVGKLTNFTYYLYEDFTLTNENIRLTDLYIDRNIANVRRYKDNTYDTQYFTAAADGRTGAVDDATYDINSEDLDEVLVNNTEQLFMAVQYGARPVFASTDSVAYTVYQNACAELAQINNSDALSDYEKVQNIYDYICKNVIYDHEIYKYMEVKNDFSVKNFGNYNIFYLEGVFYDLENQYAVCDGLSKAFVLLCRIEGIEAVKVNGIVRGSGNHAWNKVKLQDSKYSIDKPTWSVVDTTWGMVSYTDTSSNMREVLGHAYFLISERSLSHTREVTWQSGAEDTTGVEINYYKNQKFTYNLHDGDYYIENETEMQQVLDYGESKVAHDGDIFVMEIEVPLSAEDNFSVLPSRSITSLYSALTSGSNARITDWVTAYDVNCQLYLLRVTPTADGNYRIIFKFANNA